MYPAFIDCKKRCHPAFSRCVNSNRSEEECECIQECPKVMKEVCGSDNVTYDNECLLKKAACEKYTEIEIVDKGPCNQIVWRGIFKAAYSRHERKNLSYNSQDI